MGEVSEMGAVGSPNFLQINACIVPDSGEPIASPNKLDTQMPNESAREAMVAS